MNSGRSEKPVLLVTHVTAIDVGAIPDLLADQGRSSHER